MADSRYAYDDNDEVWPYFVGTVLAMVVIPPTITSFSSLIRSGNDDETKNPAIKSKFRPSNSKDIEKFRNKIRRSAFFTKKALFLIIGWISLISLIIFVYKTGVKEQKGNFDPYEILDVSFSATEREIKTKYRKLSLKYHPDKIRDVGNSTREEMESLYIQITKAYQALTDEVTRENYLKYGNPDGPGDKSHGIAIPKFFVEGKGSPLVLVAYVLLFSVVLPYLVGSWWNNSRTYTKKGIHVNTASTFVDKFVNHIGFEPVSNKEILVWISEAEEYRIALPKLTSDDIYKLLEDHINRRKSSNEQNKLLAVAKAISLLQGLVDISATFRQSDLTAKIINVQKAIVQAIPFKLLEKGELVQLPNAKFEAIEKSKVKRLGKLLNIPKEEAKKVLGIEKDEELEEALSVASKIPQIKIVRSFFKVPGEEVVPPHSTSHIVLKIVIHSSKNFKVPSGIDETKFAEEETHEALLNPFKICADQPDLPITHSPFFPGNHKASWVGLLSLQKDNRLAEPPCVLRKLDLSNLTIDSEKFLESGDKITVGTFKIPVSSPTPDQVGTYQFRIRLLNTGYFGTDVDFPINMVVEEPKLIEESGDLYGIDAPEEDSLAGAFAQMRGEKVKKSPVHGDESSDEDSEDGSDEESDWSDLNTDTEDEEEEKKTR